MGKKVKKIIPKEIRPALPAIAAIGLPYLATTGAFGGGTFATKLATFAQQNPGIAAALSNAVTQGAVEGKIDPKSAALSGIQATAGAKLQGMDLPGSPKTAAFLQKTGRVLNPASEAGSFISQTGIPPSSFSLDKALGTASAIGKGALPVASYDAAQDIKEMNEKALRDYEAKLAEQGILDKADRRNKIFGFFSRAGYDTKEVNSFLDKYGYAYGGRVGFENGGMGLDYFNKDFFDSEEKSTASFAKKMLDKGKDKGEDKGEDGDSLGVEAEDFLKALNKPKSSDLMDSLQGIISGYEMATGQSIMGAKPQPTRFGLQEGGIPVTPAARKTIRELIEAGMLEDEGEGILDLIRKNPGVLGEPMKPMKPSMENKPLSPMQMSVTDSNPDTLEEFAIRLLGRPLDQLSPEQKDFLMEEIDKLNSRYGYAEGGMMNFGGREMDMRGGGFIPIGKKERADDVPARLSKNEFVMTADAVRGAGNGSINKGAKRMYDLMNKLESKV